MKRFRLIGVALLAVFALGVAGASVAQAETAPFFTVGGTRLVAGKTHNIEAHALKPFTLTDAASATTIECSAFTLKEGVLLGSNFGSPGKDNEVVVFTGCKLLAGNGFPNCKLVSETITTEPLKSEQVESVVSGTKGNQLLEEFFAANTENGFVTLHFEGTGCTVAELIVSGQVVGEVLKDSSEEKLELGVGTPTEVTSTIVKFPPTAIKEVWLISNGIGKIQKTKQTLAGSESVQTGTALVLLANTKFEGEPNGKWSSLP